MPSLPVLRELLRETFALGSAPRVPEPELIMTDAAQVAAFHEAGREGGVMAPVYLFHATHISEVIRAGEAVLDLGCGPANQLGLVARLNPEVRFIGLDLSEGMLDMAGRNLAERGIHNVSLRRGDITRLDQFADASLDAVMSTVVLHHLPDESALFRCLAEVRRVLKPGGGLYLVDFGHFRTEATIRYFAHQYADRQPETFTTDYLNSLRAAFTLQSWREGFERSLKPLGTLHSTFGMPFMVAAKSPVRRHLPPELRERLSAEYERMPSWHRRDFRDLRTFFRLGGLRTPAFF